MTPFSHLVAERKHRRRRKDDVAPIPDSQIAELSSEWTVPGRVVLATAAYTGYTYYLPPSHDAALFVVAASPAIDRQWFYMIEAARPVYAFLDFDCGAVAAYTADSWAAAVRLCAVLFAGFAAATFMARCDTEPWRFYDASTPSKWSAHAHSRIVFASIADLHDVAARFFTWLRRRHAARDPLVAPLFFASSRAPAACIVDHSVYTERPFRLPLNRKSLGAQNYLQPAYGTAPLPTPQDEIAAGFLHPPPDTPTLPPYASVVAARRTITAALRPVGDLSAQIDEAIRGVWTGDTATLPLEQDTLDIAPATRRALVSTVGAFIEVSALQVYRGAPLTAWDGRAQLVSAAATMVPDLVGALAGTITNLDVCVVTADFLLAYAFVVLILRPHAWLAAASTDLDAWLAADEHTLPPAFDAPAAFDALRRDAPVVLPVPENAITLDCMILTDHSPFDAVS